MRRALERLPLRARSRAAARRAELRRDPRGGGVGGLHAEPKGQHDRDAQDECGLHSFSIYVESGARARLDAMPYGVGHPAACALIVPRMSDILPGMTSVSVRELQKDLKRVLARVERGETVEVTRRRLPVARLTPIADLGEPEPWPDLDERLRRIFGDRPVVPGPSQEIITDRGD